MNEPTTAEVGEGVDLLHWKVNLSGCGAEEGTPFGRIV